MATKTRAEILDMVLEGVGVKALNIAATAEDTAKVADYFDSIYQQLRKKQLVPFATSVIPDWSWIPLVAIVVGKCAAEFGVSGQRLLELREEAKQGYIELREQNAGMQHDIPTKAKYF